MKESELDFDWACSSTLLSFKLSQSSGEESFYRIIGYRLSQLEKIQHIKLQKCWLFVRKEQPLSKKLTSYFTKKKKPVQTNSEELKADQSSEVWIESL